MPPRRTRRRRKPRRRYRRRYKWNNPLTKTGLGNSLIRSLRYCTELNLNPGVGGLADETEFVANGLFDPEYSNDGSNHQPMGFDQLMTMFQNYVVLGAKMTVHFRSDDGTYPQIVGIRSSTAIGEQTDIEEIIEQGQCVYTLLENSSTNPSTTKLTFKINPNKLLGKRDPKGDSTVHGSDAANPSNKAYLKLFCGPLATVDSGGCSCFVQIDYTAMFFEPKWLSKS